MFVPELLGQSLKTYAGLVLKPRHVYVVLGLWFLLVFAYAVHLGDAVVSRDQWSYMNMLDHALSGQLQWRELWSSNSEHAKPGYKILFILDAKYLGLDLKLEIYLGLLLLGAAMLMLARDLRASLVTAPSTAWAASLLGAGLVFMSFNQSANYTYSLLALGGFAGTLLQYWFFSRFSRLLIDGAGLGARVGLMAILLAGAWGFSGARSPAVLGATLITAGLAAWLDPAMRQRVRLALPVFAVGFLALAVYVVMLRSMMLTRVGAGTGPHLGHLSYGEELQAVLMNPLGSLSYVFGLLVTSMVNLKTLLDYMPVTAADVLFGCLSIALLTWGLWRYFAARHWQRTWVPLLLILYSGLFVLEVLVARFGSDRDIAHGSSVPRYVFDSHLWLVGVAWIAGLEWTRPAPRQALLQALPVLALLCIVVTEGCNLGLALHLAPYSARGQADIQAKMHAVVTGSAPVETLPEWNCPSVSACRYGVDVLREYHLNAAR